ncbi:MAG TPA: response regulator transcription factor [Chloroflexota bacterium]|nr:response regulator transcription factor [Chloroflexota bacterium]
METRCPSPAAATAKSGVRITLVGSRLVIEALAGCFESNDDVEVTGVYPDPVQAISYIRETKPDIVVLDDITARSDAARLIRLLRGTQSEIRIVVLTAALDRRSQARYIRAGAVWCLTTDQTVIELVETLRQIGKGQVLFNADQIVDLLTAPRHPAELLTLAPRELEVLQVLATGKSAEDAAAELGISIHTLRTHLKKCMAKMGVRSKLEAIIGALRAGLIELPP